MAGKVVSFSTPEEKHTSDVTCLLFYADHVFSGGADGKIKVILIYIYSCEDFEYDYIYFFGRYGTSRLSSSKKSMPMNRIFTHWPLMRKPTVCIRAAATAPFDIFSLP